jgi:tRNA(fMet)-specific endonuclease VapC
MELAILDTDTLSEVFKRRAPKVVRRASAYLREHTQFAFSSFTRYEALRGLKERGAARQLARFEVFCEHSLIFPVTDPILDRATDLWVAARNRGFPARDADIIIAATALEHARTLVTGNTSHFSWIAGLVLKNWRD